jgi:hypothetical protein
MNVRLIKPGMASSGENHRQPPAVEAPIIETIRSWVREFQSTKANRARSDFERISNLGKT